MEYLMQRRFGENGQMMRAFAQQLKDIDEITSLAVHTAARTCAFHQEMADQVMGTLTEIEEEVMVARLEGRLTPYKRQAVEHRVQAYLYEMLDILEETDQAALAIVQEAVTGPIPDRYRLISR